MTNGQSIEGKPLEAKIEDIQQKKEEDFYLELLAYIFAYASMLSVILMIDASGYDAVMLIMGEIPFYITLAMISIFTIALFFGTFIKLRKIDAEIVFTTPDGKTTEVKL